MFKKQKTEVCKAIKITIASVIEFKIVTSRSRSQLKSKIKISTVIVALEVKRKTKDGTKVCIYVLGHTM